MYSEKPEFALSLVNVTPSLEHLLLYNIYKLCKTTVSRSRDENATRNPVTQKPTVYIVENPRVLRYAGEEYNNEKRCADERLDVVHLAKKKKKKTERF